VTFCNTLLRNSLGLYDWKILIKTMNKFIDLTEERIEELRAKHKISIEKGITPEDLEQVRETINNSQSSWPSSTDVFTGISSTYKALSGALDSLYQRSREGYSKYVTKKQAEKATKSKTLKKLLKYLYF
jgi:MoxR-like ATPase